MLARAFLNFFRASFIVLIFVYRVKPQISSSSSIMTNRWNVEIIEEQIQSNKAVTQTEKKQTQNKSLYGSAGKRMKGSIRDADLW